MRLSVAGRTYVQIAAELGYGSAQAAHKDVKAVLEEYRKRQDLAAADLIAKHEMMLEQAIAKAMEIMGGEHLAHGNGKVVRRLVSGSEADGDAVYEEVLDSGPNLAAALAVTRISESWRKLKGLDAPTKTTQQVDGTINYVINATPEELEQL